MLAATLLPPPRARRSRPHPHRCSDGVSPDWTPTPADAFGAGLDGDCPRAPADWPLDKVVSACEKLCAPAAVCLGFTLYPAAHNGGPPSRNLTECCFRTGGVGDKPKCTTTKCQGTRCYEKFHPAPPPPPSSNITIAVDRRPYVFEQTGHLLVRSTAAIAGAHCAVTAKLAGGGATLSNGSWTHDLSVTGVVSSFAFSLEPLPASIFGAVHVTIDCASIGWKTERWRSFQRAPVAGAPPVQSVSQVDSLTRTIRVGGVPFLSVGWYYSIFDNGERNLTEFVSQQARAGVNTLLLYTFPMMMLHGKAELQREVLDACDAVGMKVLMDISQFVPLIGGSNSTENWTNFKAVIEDVRAHPATLGYYLCDDCWGHSPALQAKVYRAIKEFDPYHVTSGAGGTSVGFSDGEGEQGYLSLSLDVPLIENYDEDLAGRTSSGAPENSARDWPQFWTPFINCPWSESSNQMALPYYDVGYNADGAPSFYSPHRMRSTAYASLVGDAAIPNLVFFDYFTMTEDRLLHGVQDIAQEMLDLKPSLLAPVTTKQPSVNLTGGSESDGLRGRAWAEDVIGSAAGSVCIHVIVLNTLNHYLPVDATLSFDDGRSLPAQVNASLPFEGNSDRVVPVDHGRFEDMIGPNSVNVYRVGCRMPAAASSGSSSRNYSPNPSFELPSLLGGVTGWSGGRAGWWAADGHDLRARMFLDTTNPQHGRYSLRITVPTAEPLVQMWGQLCVGPTLLGQCNADSDGIFLAKDTTFEISLFARCETASATPMKLEILAGHWQTDPVEAAGYHTVGKYVRNETFASSPVNGTWRRIHASVAASTADRTLQLRFSGGRGMMFLDNTFIGINMTASRSEE